MELARETKLDIDITSEAELLSFTFTSPDPGEVLVRAQLGSTLRPIQGNGNYEFHVYINGTEIMPISIVAVADGAIKAIFISRTLPLEPDDVVTVASLGLDGDTSIDSLTTIRDATPLHRAELLGSGTVAVDHNYGGVDAMTVMTSNGARVAGVTLLAYRADDYTNGHRASEYILGRTTTDQDGRWVAPILLDPGDYALVVFKQAAIEPRSVTFSVN